MSFPSHSLNPKACLAEARTCGSRFRFMWINIFCFNGTNFIARNDARQMQKPLKWHAKRTSEFIFLDLLKSFKGINCILLYTRLEVLRSGESVICKFCYKIIHSIS